MCGRYALGIRASFVRHQLQQQGMQVDDAPQDEDVRETYNFPPGAFGLVYRAVVPDGGISHDSEQSEELTVDEEPEDSLSKEPKSYNYELKAMKWGLIPFWTKRSPDYSSMLRTINCRDDSLIENRGMWNTMKQRKRCVIIAQGFYEWLKKGPGGKEKVPHFTKRKDGNLMCFAGLWDCVKYEDSEQKLYTYSIITTDSNKQLNFLHDRMPVILDPNSAAMNLWLDPTQNKWTKELQSILKPYKHELDCYPVNQAVGKVGNNSPDFIIPVDSKENKNNIANFFGNAEKQKKQKVEHEEVEHRQTRNHESTEDNAPIPVPNEDSKTSKRKHEAEDEKSNKSMKREQSKISTTPSKSPNIRKTRSATSNEGMTIKTKPTRSSDGSQQITNFFAK